MSVQSVGNPSSRAQTSQGIVESTGGRSLTPCAKCRKSIRGSSDLIKHHRVRMGEKPYDCPECGKAFSQNSHLLSRQRVHTGERPFECSACGKALGGRTAFLKHQRLHPGEPLGGGDRACRQDSEVMGP